MHTKKMTQISLFVTLAMMMSYVEFLIPIPIFIVGMKLGFANAVVVLMLYLYEEKIAVFVSLLRVVLMGFLFTGFGSMLYSLVGAILSLSVMILAKKMKVFGILGVSALGGIFHNIGQISVAVLIMENLNLYYYLPVLLISGVATGVLIGILVQTALPYVRRNFE